MKMLFLDPTVASHMTGDARLSVCPPSEMRVAFKRDRPYENFISLYCSYLYDDECGEYRIYYIARDKSDRSMMALASSKDGLNFTKPNLGVLEYDGSKENNLMNIPGGDGNVFIDRNAPHTERYKYLTHFYGSGLFLYVSEDGIHWSDKRTLIAPLMLDGCNMALYDDTEKCYRYYIRGWELTKNKMARIALWGECDKLTPFELKEPLPYRNVKNEQPYADTKHFNYALSCDEHDLPSADLYTLPVSCYPDSERYFIAFPSLYRHGDAQTGLENDGFVESGFAASRDGKVWERFDRTPYIRNEIAGENQNSMSYFGTGVHLIGDMIYSCGIRYSTRHGEVKRRREEGDGVVVLYGQRRDGYVCADFGRGGSVEVKSRRLGDVLRLNVDTGAVGWLKLVCECGSERFEAEICGNSLSHEVKLPEGFIGKSARLSFEGANARLFAIETDEMKLL